jgi:type IV secretory pathway TrbF-like protein
MKSWWRKEAMAAMPVDNGQVEQSPNPYLDARWQWNSQVDRAFGAAHAWQIMGIAGLLIGLGGSCRDHLRWQPKQVCAVRDRGEWFGGRQ